MPPQRNKVARYGDSKKFRTVDSYFCPHYGSQYRPSLRQCPSSTCGKQLTQNARCGKCHLPREDAYHLYCRYCGLSYAEVGVVRPVQQPEVTTNQDLRMGDEGTETI